jgi:hypothetical protein
MSVGFQLVAKLDSLLLRLAQNDYSVLLKRHLATPRTGPDAHLRPIGPHLQLKRAHRHHMISHLSVPWRHHPQVEIASLTTT